MSSLISKPLATIFSEFERQWQNTAYPQVDYDAKWLSSCIIGEPLSQVVSWHPVIRDIAGDFSGIEAALELQIHPSIKAFYGDYFSEILAVDFQDNTIELVQAWNDQDFDMLLENIIGHVLMQRRLKQAETVFIASTEDEMQVVSINNNSGEIVLEQLGKGVDRVLASTLEEFLAQLSLAK